MVAARHVAAMNLGLTLTRHPDELKQLFNSLGSVGDIANLLEIPQGYLVYALYRSSLRHDYRTFQIAKKTGGVRDIAVPPRPLKIIQSKLNTVLQLVYPLKPSVHGFVGDRSILSNARRHVDKRLVLNVDLEDFFPSINFGRVRGVFMAQPYGLGEKAATALAQICCYDNHIAQGAPTSPIVSNMICARLDSQLQRLARKHKCIYTRYADDLTFSTTLPSFPEQIATHERGWATQEVSLGPDLLNVIESNGFRVNPKKQRVQNRSCHQEVTGLTVNKVPNVRRRYVRQVRAMLHAWEKFGLEAAQEEFRAKYDRRRSRHPDWQAPSFDRVVRGKLDFLKMVRGQGDPVYRRLANKLHALEPGLIDHLPEPPRDPNNPWSHWVEQYKDLVFHLELDKRDGRKISGTAFAWRRRALATAAHNLDGQVCVSPPFPEGEPVSPGDFLFHPSGDEKVDVAVVRLPQGVSGLNREFPVRIEPLNHGEQVAALAYATVPWREPGLGFHPGVVESRLPIFGGRVETIQVTIELSGGMSGGPVIDRWGNLVGIVMETTFEQTEDGVPGRAFHHIIPVRYLLDIDLADTASG